MTELPPTLDSMSAILTKLPLAQTLYFKIKSSARRQRLEKLTLDHRFDKESRAHLAKELVFYPNKRYLKRKIKTTEFVREVMKKKRRSRRDGLRGGGKINACTTSWMKIQGNKLWSGRGNDWVSEEPKEDWEKKFNEPSISP
ncbi:hypothetical protein CHS0354_041205 [Potamilus streckersoni]|uniref:Uncharacterized protein n=1 Tax=Potamilus streckersoni TaxID=2493646 RepID=A0AAE0SEE1_9BIVA|nr:hypothetical protein CHS0354_041205 [Potamilus streckersoni]